MDIYGGQGFVEVLHTIPTHVKEGCTTKDYLIAEAASCSHNSKITDDDKVTDLLMKLFSWGHYSPFEQATISFYIKAPMVVFWQLDRHRTFRYGSHLRRSGRYTKFTKDEFYIPEYFSGNEKSNLEYRIDRCISDYEYAIKMGMKKESARFFLPAWCMIYEEYMNVDLKNLMHFLSLRTNEAAQIEIRELANAMYDLTKKEFPITMKIFNDSGREAVDYDFK